MLCYASLSHSLFDYGTRCFPEPFVVIVFCSVGPTQARARGSILFQFGYNLLPVSVRDRVSLHLSSASLFVLHTLSLNLTCAYVYTECVIIVLGQWPLSGSCKRAELREVNGWTLENTWSC